MRSDAKRVDSVSLYEQTAERYDAVRFAGRAGRWVHELQASIVRKFCGHWQGKRVLEVGCGTGRITEALAAMGCRVLATDPAKAALTLARKRLASSPHANSVEFASLDIGDAAALQQRFDGVITVNVFGHLPCAREAIRNFASAMAPQGELLFNFPCLASIFWPFGAVVNVRGKSLGRPVSSRWYWPAQIEGMLEDAGLRVQRWAGHHYVPVTDILFPAWPALLLCESLIARNWPKRCPSVFALCIRTSSPGRPP